MAAKKKSSKTSESEEITKIIAKDASITGVDIVENVGELAEVTTSKLSEIEASLAKIDDTIAEQAKIISAIKGANTTTSKKVKELEGTVGGLLQHVEDINKQSVKSASILKDVDNRLTSMEQREKNMRKDISISISDIYSRINKLENPKHAVIEIKPANDDDEFVIPTPSKDGSIGDDLVITKDFWLPYGRTIVPLNICINLPRGIEGKIEGRSGFNARGIYGKVTRYVSECILFFFHKPAVEVTTMENMDADVINGKIDPGYHDGVGVIINNHGLPFMVSAGTRIAQITYYKTVAHKYKKVEQFSDSTPYVKNREGGFCSSGTGVEENNNA